MRETKRFRDRDGNWQAGYLKLTLGEAREIAALALTLRRSAGQADTTTTMAAIWTLTADRALSALVGEFDMRLSTLSDLIETAVKAGLVVPDSLARPRTSREKYLGLDHKQAHIVRRFKHGKIIREEAERIGTERADRSTRTEFDQMALDLIGADLMWPELASLPTEPTEEIAALIEINREAERAKRKETRVSRKADDQAGAAEAVAELGQAPTMLVQMTTAKKAKAEAITTRRNLARECEWRDLKIAEKNREIESEREKRELAEENYRSARAYIDRLKAELADARSRIAALPPESFDQWRQRIEA